MNKHLKKIIIFILLGIAGCGGGSNSSNESLLIRGNLIQGESVTHSRTSVLKHSASQPIEEVEICALGKCATTDNDGNWGFLVDYTSVPDHVTFTVNGHGISTSSVVHLPDGSAKDGGDIAIEFVHSNNVVSVHEIEVDGESIEQDHHH